MASIVEKLNKAYFWDTNPALLDDEKSKRLIIERVINYGNIEEIKLIKEHYGVEQIKKTLCELNYIDEKTLNFVSILFKIPLEKFKCYTKKQLSHQHWNY
jgi:hypothetical protein